MPELERDHPTEITTDQRRIATRMVLHLISKSCGAEAANYWAAGWPSDEHLVEGLKMAACGTMAQVDSLFATIVPTAVHGQIDLGRARNLNERDPPENLIRSGCARVLVDDLINEVEFLRDVVTGRQERARIVAWLRRYNDMNFRHTLADRIENGEHLK